MKTLAELQIGDWLAFERIGSLRREKNVHLMRITGKDNGWLLVGRNSKFKADDPYAGALGKARIPTADEIATKEAADAEAAKLAAERLAFESRESYKLAARIARETESGNYDQLSTMPIDRLRQIVAWLDELKGQQ